MNGLTCFLCPITPTINRQSQAKRLALALLKLQRILRKMQRLRLSHRKSPEKSAQFMKLSPARRTQLHKFAIKTVLTTFLQGCRSSSIKVTVSTIKLYVQKSIRPNGPAPRIKGASPRSSPRIDAKFIISASTSECL